MDFKSIITLYILCLFETSFSYLLNSKFKYRESSLSAGFGKGKSKIKSTDKVTVVVPQITSEDLCKCHSNIQYGQCCEKYHNQSSYPINPVELVRSRYSAYAMGNITYIMLTTHPTHHEYATIDQTSKYTKWMKSLKHFVDTYDFLGLKFININRDSNISPDVNATTVQFKAKLKGHESVYSTQELTETSTFLKSIEGHWLYADGKVSAASLELKPKSPE